MGKELSYEALDSNVEYWLGVCMALENNLRDAKLKLNEATRQRNIKYNEINGVTQIRDDFE